MGNAGIIPTTAGCRVFRLRREVKGISDVGFSSFRVEGLRGFGFGLLECGFEVQVQGLSFWM